MAHLGGLRQGCNLLAGPVHFIQGGLGRGIEVPQVVMHCLEVPGDLAAVSVQGDHGAGIVIQPLLQGAAQAAEIVGSAVAGGHEYQLALGVDRYDGPHVGGALLEALAGIRQVGVDAGGQRVPVPGQLATAHIESPHHTAGRIGAAVVQHLGPGDHQVAEDSRWRGDGVFAGSVFSQAQAQVQLAALAEVLTGLAGAPVQRDEAAVQGAREDPVLAGLAPGQGILPAADAAAVGERHRADIDLWVIDPALAPGGGVQGEHPVEGGAVVQGIVDHDGRYLQGALRHGPVAVPESAAGPALAGFADIAGAMLPQQFQLLHVGGGDLGQGRVMATPRAGAVVTPVVLGEAGAGQGRQHQAGSADAQRSQRGLT